MAKQTIEKLKSPSGRAKDPGDQWTGESDQETTLGPNQGIFPVLMEEGPPDIFTIRFLNCYVLVTDKYPPLFSF